MVQRAKVTIYLDEDTAEALKEAVRDYDGLDANLVVVQMIQAGIRRRGIPIGPVEKAVKGASDLMRNSGFKR